MSVLAFYALARPDVWLAAPPFLPPGRGGLILIIGGLSMLAFALFLLTVTQHPLPGGVTQAHASVGAARTGVARRRQPQARRSVKPRSAARSSPAVLSTALASTGTAQTRTKEQMNWPDFIMRAAAREGLGRSHVLSVRGTSCTMLIEDCLSCRRRKRHCKDERRVLQRAARRLSRHAEVREVSCNIDRRHACAFELRMRGRP